MTSIGIDIGSHSIKVAEVEPSSSGATLVNYQEFPLSAQPNTDDDIIIIDILRNYLAHIDLEKVTFNVAINQNYVTHRRTFFPFKERHSIQRALPLEIEDDVPFTPENAIFDAKVLSYQSGTGANVLASITPREQIEESLQACKDSGFEPSILSCETLAYSNLFENWNDLPPQRTDLVDRVDTLAEDDEEENESSEIPSRLDAGALLHIGRSKTLLMIYQNKELLTCRTLGWGARNLATEVHKKYNIPLSEAFKELESKSFILISTEGATEAQAAFSNTLEEPLAQFGKRLKLTYMEIESELNISINKCSITGGGSQVKNLGPFLTQRTEVSTNPLAPEIPTIRNRTSSYNSITGGVALGLAIEGIKKPRNPATNFLKGEFARGSHGFGKFKERWGSTIRMGVAGFCILLIHSCVKSNMSETNYFEAQDNLRTLAKKEKSIKRASSRAVQEFIRNKKQLKTKMKDLEKIEEINSALDVVASLSKAVPSGRNIQMDIIQLKIKDEDVQIVGYLNQSDNLQALETGLKSIARKKAIRKLPLKVTPKPGKKSFAYSFKTSRLSRGL